MRRSVRWGVFPVLMGVVGAGTAVAQAASPAAREPSGAARTVTLITGDRVTLRGAAVSVLPGEGREDIGFRVVRTYRAGVPHISVVPADAERPLARRTLDARLFDVTELVRIGRDDTRSRSLPLIVAGRRAAFSAQASDAVPGRALPALDGGALSQPKDSTGELWASLLKGRLADRVWLDGRSRVLDDVSNKVVGAPTAWKAGLTGKGVLVADLDTGIDAAHPDFKGRIAGTKDFTARGTAAGNVKDGMGHGTHTASTIAGTGAASKGAYAGVAPDARLLIGKVCDDNGGCTDSDIIAGMEWAADQHAVAVNMSLGDTGTDGTDPVSTALNRLTARTGTLFVVAAGNEGPPAHDGLDGTIGSPGSADAALTVGSTTKDDALSDFSSQGPRLGDDAVKPDLVAPGSDIIAARASGTNLDTPVDNPAYVQSSGTSMATPHVTGAVALLAQAHPDWRAADFKRALTSAAHGLKNLTAFQQGAGRLDIPRALRQRVYATSGAANLGLFAWPHTDTTAARQVTYRNDTAAPVTLELALDVYGPGGRPAPAGMFTLGRDTLTVPARGTATATLTARTTRAQTGRFGGAVVATAGDTAVRTATGLFAEPERHTLTIRGVNRAGEPAAGATLQVFGPRTGIRQDIRLGADGTFRLRLPDDTYDVVGVDDSLAPGTRTLLAASGVRTDRDRSLLLDARTAGKVGARVDRKGVTALSTSATVRLTPAKGDDTYQVTVVAGPKTTLYATPTGPGPSYTAATTLTGPGHRYSLRTPVSDGVPRDTEPVVHDRQLGTVRAAYTAQGGRRAVAIRIDQPAGDLYTFSPQLPVTLGSVITEHYSPGLSWTHTLDLYETTKSLPDGSLPDHETSTEVRAYQAGRAYRTDWNRAPVGPAVRKTVRDGDSLQIEYQAFGLDDFNATGVVDGSVVLSSGGRVIDRATPYSVILTAPAAKRRYTLTADTTRTAGWTALGTRTTVAWGFTSARGQRTVPLLTVGAGGAVDLKATAWAGRDFRLPLTVHRPTASPVTRLVLRVSYDDGRTWTDVRVNRRGDTGMAVLRHPGRTGYVSLRVSAADNAGNTVTQTVLRAYRFAPAT